MKPTDKQIEAAAKALAGHFYDEADGRIATRIAYINDEWHLFKDEAETALTAAMNIPTDTLRAKGE